MITDADVIEQFAETSEGYAETIGAREATELATTFNVRFEIEDDAGRSAALHLGVPGGMREQIRVDRRNRNIVGSQQS